MYFLTQYVISYAESTSDSWNTLGMQIKTIACTILVGEPTRANIYYIIFLFFFYLTNGCFTYSLSFYRLSNLLPSYMHVHTIRFQILVAKVKIAKSFGSHHPNEFC